METSPKGVRLGVTIRVWGFVGPVSLKENRGEGVQKETGRVTGDGRGFRSERRNETNVVMSGRVLWGTGKSETSNTCTTGETDTFPKEVDSWTV